MEETMPNEHRSGLLVNRNYALLWCGQIVSFVGDFFLTTTLILWITTGLARNQSRVALAVSGVALSAAVATLGMGPLAGVFVDRWNKRQTMLRMDLARGLLLLILMALTGLLPLPINIQLPLAAKLGAIYSILLLAGICSQFFGPSRMALIGDIVAKEDRPSASGMSQAAFNLALILGPILAAPLFLAFGPGWAMLIDAVSFFASYLCIRLIKAPPSASNRKAHTKGTYLNEFRAGWKTIASRPALIALIVNGIIIFAGAGAMDAFYVLFALTNLHTPTSLAGFFGPAYGIGVLLASLPGAWLARRLGEGKLLTLGTLTWGLCMVLFSRSTSFLPGVIVFGLLGVANGSTNVCVGPLFLYLTPREFVGRVSAIMNPGITLSSMLSAALAGYLVSGPLLHLDSTFLGMSFSGLNTVFLGAGLMVMLAGIYCLKTLARVSSKNEVV